jgi:kynurenine formamidase
MQEVARTLSRRDVLKLGATAALAAVGSCVACASGAGEHSHGVIPPLPELQEQGSEHVSFKEPLSLRVSNLLDLTHTLSGAFPVIPVPGITFPFKQTVIATIEKQGVYANKWEMIDHNGTHIDATNHFNPLGYDLKDTPLKSLLAPLVVLDVKARAAKDNDTVVTIDDITAWEKQHGRLPARAAVFMDSGWDAKVSSPHDFLNVDASNTLHFPGFAEEALAFLLAERDISGVGVDTISFDPGFDKAYRGHKTLFKGGKWGIENIKNLGRAPRSGGMVFIGATKVEGASGGPARLLALW